MITTTRDQYVAGHVTQEVKDRLAQQAKQQRVSRSRLIYEILCKALGVSIEGT